MPPPGFQDYYEVLGVPRDADAQAIRKAYRKLALRWHPDRHPEGPGRQDAAERFKRISEAYEVLSNEDTRKRYDRFGADWKQGQPFTPPPEGGGPRPMSPEEFREAFGDAGGFSDFFRSAFGGDFGGQSGRQTGGPGGGARGRRHARFRHRGADVHAELSLGLGDALAGGKRGFDIDARVPCLRCGGVGLVETHVCGACGGIGWGHARRTVELQLPRRLRDGMTLRLKGLGEPGESGGEVGDLLLTLRLRDDDVYRRDGDDLWADVPVAPWEALAGAAVEVATPHGGMTVKVPPGSKAGTRLRLRGKGLARAPSEGGGHGDFHVVLRLALPDTLNARQRELVDELGRAGPSTVRGGARVSPKG